MYKSPSRSDMQGAGRGQGVYCDNQTFDGVANEYPTIERPPSYETSMRDGTVTNNYYASDRQSVRSLRSVRSKASSKSKSNRNRDDTRPKDLPWVQITPSSGSMDAPFRHYPQSAIPQFLSDVSLATAILDDRISLVWASKEITQSRFQCSGIQFQNGERFDVVIGNTSYFRKFPVYVNFEDMMLLVLFVVITYNMPIGHNC